jgi:hypothetical protein
MHFLAAALLTGASSPADAGRSPHLRLGRVRVVADGVVAVPVELVARRADRIAALNFDLTYDPAALALAPDGITAGPAVTSAGAELATRADETGGRARALVLPPFRPDMPVLRGRRVATVRLVVRGRGGRGPARWVRRHVRLERVVLADAQGRELQTAPARRGR